MPLGAFVSSQAIMSSLTHDPVLGHITTFGGHPVCCAAGMAAMEVLTMGDMIISAVGDKEELFKFLLRHEAIKSVSGKGLLIAVQLETTEKVQWTLQQCLAKGLFSDWFLFAPDCIRIAPPLTITFQEITSACQILLSCL